MAAASAPKAKPVAGKAKPKAKSSVRFTLPPAPPELSTTTLRVGQPAKPSNPWQPLPTSPVLRTGRNPDEKPIHGLSVTSALALTREQKKNKLAKLHEEADQALTDELRNTQIFNQAVDRITLIVLTGFSDDDTHESCWVCRRSWKGRVYSFPIRPDPWALYPIKCCRWRCAKRANMMTPGYGSLNQDLVHRFQREVLGIQTVVIPAPSPELLQWNCGENGLSLEVFHAPPTEVGQIIASTGSNILSYTDLYQIRLPGGQEIDLDDAIIGGNSAPSAPSSAPSAVSTTVPTSSKVIHPIVRVRASTLEAVNGKEPSLPGGPVPQIGLDTNPSNSRRTLDQFYTVEDQIGIAPAR